MSRKFLLLFLFILCLTPKTAYSETHWSDVYVRWLEDRDFVLSEIPDPDRKMSRADFDSFLHFAKGEEESLSFRLDGEESFSRREGVCRLAKELNWGEPEGRKGDFSDMSSISQPCRRYIRSAADRQVVEGYPDGTFRPEEPLTYGEGLAIAARLKFYDPKSQGDGRYWNDVNTAKNFSRGYLLLNDDLERGRRLLSSSDNALLRERQVREWQGSEFGMTMTSGMFGTKSLPLYSRNGNRIFDLSVLPFTDDYRFQSMLNYYQLFQYTHAYGHTMTKEADGWGIGAARRNCPDLKTYADVLCRGIDEYEIGGSLLQVTAMFHDGEGYRGFPLIPTEYREDRAGIHVTVYDPNRRIGELLLDGDDDKIVAVSKERRADGSHRKYSVIGSDCIPTKLLLDGMKGNHGCYLNLLITDRETEMKVETDRGEFYTGPKNFRNAFPSRGGTDRFYSLPGSDYYNFYGIGDHVFSLVGCNRSLTVSTEDMRKLVVGIRRISLEESKGAFQLRFTENTLPENFSFHTIEITGDHGDGFTVRKMKDGYKFRGKDMSGIRIIGREDDRRSEVTVPEGVDVVWLREENGRLRLR